MLRSEFKGDNATANITGKTIISGEVPEVIEHVLSIVRHHAYSHQGLFI